MFILKFIYRFFKFIFLEICSFFIKFILAIFLLGFIVAIFLKNDSKDIEKGSYLTIKLSNEYKENLSITPLDFKELPTTFYGLLRKIEYSKNDSNIDGIILLTDNNKLNRAQIAELGEALKDFKKSNKKVYSYGANLDNNSFLISTYATESIMPPSASTTVNITGYNATMPYYKNIAEKVGVNFNVIHVGDYKTYGENFTHDHMTPQLKEDLDRVLNGSYNIFVQRVAKNLNMNLDTINSKILNGDLMGESSKSLKNDKLISNLSFYENFKKEKKIEKIVEIEDYEIKTKNYDNKIAIVYADGEINYNEENGIDSSKIYPEKMITLLKRAEEDKNVKGIVLRVNSPGGSALASDIIYNYIKEIKKPVYISVGNMAASGGYYISSAGKKIFANKESIVGSIGVVSLIPNFEKLSEKVGINFEEVSKGKYSDLYSLTAPMTEEKKEKIYNENLNVYKEFLNIVSTNRKIPLNELETIAQGKIWLGTEGVNNHLVDNIGGINDTIDALAKDLKLEKYCVVEVAYKEKMDDFFNAKIPFLGKASFFSLENLKNMDKEIKNNDLFYKPLMLFFF